MANKAGGVGINCLAEDVVTADWQRQMTLVLTPAAWMGKILNHRDLWRWRSWEEMPVKQQHNPELRFHLNDCGVLIRCPKATSHLQAKLEGNIAANNRQNNNTSFICQRLLPRVSLM